MKKSFYDIGTEISSSFETKLKNENKSSYFSESEHVLLFWLKSAFEKINKKQIRLNSFRDLRTSSLIASIIGIINFQIYMLSHYPL